MVSYRREGCGNQIFQLRSLTGYNQILQIHRTVEAVSVVHGVNNGNIVIFSGLTDKFSHGLAYGQRVVNLNEVRGHDTTDLVVLVRENQLDVTACVFIHQFHDLLLYVVIELFQHVYSVVGVHV